MHRLFTLAVSVGLLLVMAVPASAAKPEVVFEFEDEVVDQLVPPLSDECGFDVYVSESVRGIEKVYLDDEENVLKVTFKIRGTSVWSSANATLQPEHWAWNGTFDPETETFMERGNFWNVHNAGPLLIESGRALFGPAGEKFAGQFPTLEEGGFDAFCAALAP